MSRPLQNRVQPDGEIVAQNWRGTVMGNRGGRLHADKKLVRRWASKQWIICVLDFKDRHRQVMGDGYTELFFFDEATALSAGHRPCFECQRARAIEFANVFPGPGRTRAAQIDQILHDERTASPTSQRVVNLPEASFVRVNDVICLWLHALLLPWSPTGYRGAIATPDHPVEVLTPKSTLACLRAGYKPALHISAMDAR